MSARRSLVSLSVLAVAAALCLSVAAAAAPDYRTRNIDLPKGVPYAGGTISKVYVNTAGVMTVTFGDADCLCHAALVANGRWTLLDPPGALQTVASNPNAWGQVALSYQTGSDPSGPWSGGLYWQRRYTALPDLPGYDLYALEALNDLGVFCGVNASWPFVGLFGTQFGQTPFHYPDTPDVCCTRPRQINDWGIAVGTCGDPGLGRHGFVYDSHTGLGADLTDPWGNLVVQAVAINNLGDTVALTCWEGGSGAIVMAKDGYLTLPTTAMPDPGASCVDADAINDLGQVSGVYTDRDGLRHGFLATPLRSKRTA